MAAHYVVCPICGKKFNRDNEDCVKYGARRYAHQVCMEQIPQEQKDKQELEEYIKQLFGTEFVEARVQKQIKKYIEENKFTYSGIKKALVYFFEIKHGDVNKARGSIGIVEYIYREAYSYYHKLWEAQQINKGKDVSGYYKVREIKIKPPKRELLTKKRFTFLDEE